MVLQGRQPAARKLLRLHTGFSTEPFISADELLRKTPALGEGAGAGADFELRWRHWQEQCVLRLEAGEFSYSPRLQTLVKVRRRWWGPRSVYTLPAPDWYFSL